MTPRVRNPLPQLTPARLSRLLDRIDPMLHRVQAALPVQWTAMIPGLIEWQEAARMRFTPAVADQPFGPSDPGDRWHSRWLRIAIPAAAAGEKGQRFLKLDCDGEMTVFIDGKPWAGNDIMHRLTPLPDRACELLIELGTWQTAIWGPPCSALGNRPCRFRAAELVLRDRLAWDCYHDLDVLHMLMWQLLNDAGIKPGAHGQKRLPDSCEPLLRQVLKHADTVCNAFDRAGLRAARAACAEAFAALKAAPWQPRLERIGHAHIDLVWLWPEAVTERKGVHTFSSMLRLMERYPELVFTQSQPALYRAIARRAPSLMKDISKRIRSGQWEVQGGFEVEPDTHMPCGEALARSLALGQEHITTLKGRSSPLCWIPDVFGYSAALPQILALGGCQWFYTTKMTWSAITRFPYNSFVWRGADGTEILTHLCTTGYNDACDATQAVATLRDHRQADVHPAQLVGTGYGDGGGGVTEKMCERTRRMADLAGVPRQRWLSAESFFADLETKREHLPVYQGELYLEYHRGTFTTQSDYKRLFRALESALQTAEAVRVATRAKPLDDADWLRLAFGQFHDAIPGSSIGLVYQQLNAEFAQRVERLRTQAGAELQGKRPLGSKRAATGWTIFNAQPTSVRRVVAIPGAHADLCDADGFALPANVQQRGAAASTLCLVDLPACASTVIRAAAADGPATPIVPVLATARSLDNGMVSARFDAQGRLSALRIDGSDVGLSAPAWLRWYHDHPALFDAWDIDHQALSLPCDDIPGVALTIAESGPLRAVLAGTGMIGDSPFTIRYTLDAGSRYVHVEVAVDWRAEHALLKFHCPTVHRGRFARFGTPFGSVERTQLPGIQADEAMWEVPASRWAAVCDDSGCGLAMITQAKYGFSCKDGDLGLSLLRAPKDPDPKADRGQHAMRFAIGAHVEVADQLRSTTAAAADSEFAETLVVSGEHAATARFALEDAGSLVAHWAKPEPDGGFTLRLHEVSGRSGTAHLVLADDATVTPQDFLGNAIAEALNVAHHRAAVAYRPYQILSLRVAPL